MKSCTKCGILKSVSGYHRNKRTYDGIQPICKDCINAYSRQRIANFTDEERTIKRDRDVMWHKMHPASVREHRMTYYYGDLDRQKIRSKVYRDNNGEKVRIIAKRWSEANPARRSEYGSRRRARYVEAYVEDVTPYISQLTEIQKNKCIYCVKSFDVVRFTIDHIIPLSRGGKHAKENVQLVCGSCNSSKGNKTHEEYVRYLGVVCDV